MSEQATDVDLSDTERAILRFLLAGKGSATTLFWVQRTASRSILCVVDALDFLVELGFVDTFLMGGYAYYCIHKDKLITVASLV
jgi:hypothetical protein